MTTHEIARLLLERPDGKLVVSVDVSTGEEDALRRAFGEFYLGWQSDINPEDTVLIFEGYIND